MSVPCKSSSVSLVSGARLREPCVGDLLISQFQRIEVHQLAQMYETSVRNLRTDERQREQRPQRLPGRSRSFPAGCSACGLTCVVGSLDDTRRRHRLLQLLHAGLCDSCVAQIQLLQVFEPLQFFQPRIANVRAIQIKLRQAR